MITSHRDLHALQNYDYNSRSAFKFHSKFGWNRRDQPRSGGIGSHLIRSDIRQRIGAARMAWPRERRMGLGRRAREPSPPSHGRVRGRGLPSLGRMFEGGGLPLPSWESVERGVPLSSALRAGRSGRQGFDDEAKTRGGFRRLSSKGQSVSGPQSGLLSGSSMCP